ncbi:putative F420-0 ABC transporter substrate-binding protein [Pelagibacterium sp.]|uniref:putative F420-0 ABC transporter substrate-binding protein n=1 Tax=Pelagibacterium sp. TaxID=1967288 RepID=UPI003A950767
MSQSTKSHLVVGRSAVRLPTLPSAGNWLKVASLSVLTALSVAPAKPGFATDYPLTLVNCGTAVTFDAPPERVVAIKSTATELLLALGLADRIVGVGFQDGAVPDGWAPETPLTVLADRVPSQEVVLEAEPDLVYGGWESSFAADGAGTRDSLHALGVATYVAPTACRSGAAPEKLSFEDVFDQISEMGRIFDVEDRAAELLGAQRTMLEEIKPVAGLTGVWYSSATDTPYVGAGLGGPQMTMEALGITNIFAEIDDTWTSASWEAIVDADPDIMVLVDAAWNSVTQKIRLLNDNPATANLSAVQNERFIVIPFPAAEPGIRSIPAAADLARQLQELDLGQ